MAVGCLTRVRFARKHQRLKTTFRSQETLSHFMSESDALEVPAYQSSTIANCVGWLQVHYSATGWILAIRRPSSGKSKPLISPRRRGSPRWFRRSCRGGMAGSFVPGGAAGCRV
ncbi:hypothetical protein PVAP13_9KG221950 [Panicum virgatum]|uniref:Uncharacterized protein n=1 Tax=Panicum virgatum TaxID=38727 RepID=A0A8T0P5L9_PANVG|nr:hypothetical protein PVAP13_9KG221950 [Panicum virgatum]